MASALDNATGELDLLTAANLARGLDEFRKRFEKEGFHLDLVRHGRELRDGGVDRPKWREWAVATLGIPLNRRNRTPKKCARLI